MVEREEYGKRQRNIEKEENEPRHAPLCFFTYWLAQYIVVGGFLYVGTHVLDVLIFGGQFICNFARFYNVFVQVRTILLSMPR